MSLIGSDEEEEDSLHDSPVSARIVSREIVERAADDLLQAVLASDRVEFLRATEKTNGAHITGTAAVKLLVQASKHNPSFYITELINIGVDPNSHDENGMTALFWVQEAAAIHSLISHGADPWLRDSTNRFPAQSSTLNTPTSSSQRDRLRHFNDAILKYTPYGRVWNAVLEGYMFSENDVVMGTMPMRWISNDGTIITGYPLTLAINLLATNADGHDERMRIVQKLLEVTQDVNTQDNMAGVLPLGFSTTPLAAAIVYAGRHEKGNPALVSQLLRKGADPKVVAAIRRSSSVCLYATVLFTGYFGTRLDRVPGVLKLLLDAGADVSNPMDISGYRCDAFLALSIVSDGGLLERGPVEMVVNLLLEHGCPIDARKLAIAFPHYEKQYRDKYEVVVQLVNQHNQSATNRLMR